jgi:methylmalonyl-CoA/ethylmalonyl-CoA epimerase
MQPRLNHIALAVPDLAVAVRDWSRIPGVAISPPEDLPEHGIRLVFVTLANCRLELMEPLGENSPVAGFLARNPRGGLHHLSLEVPDLGDALQDLAGKGIAPLAPPRPGAHGTPVAFLHPRHFTGALVELEETT